MQLITDQIHDQLLANGARFATNADFDPPPAVKLFTPDAGATWLLASLDPAAPAIAFGRCDLGLGFPELGTVSLTELAEVRGAIGLRSSATCSSAPTDRSAATQRRAWRSAPFAPDRTAGREGEAGGSRATG